MASGAKQKSDPIENGTVPQEKTFDISLTGQEVQLIHTFCTQVPIGGAQEKLIAAYLQAKLEQLVGAEQNGAPE